MEIKNKLLTWYGMLPPSVQRLGTNYREVHDFYKKAQWWKREQITEWQLKRLQEVVRYAYERTDGYRQLYDEAKVTPDDIKTLDDIKSLPFTDKGLIRDNLEAFTVKTRNTRDLFKTTTGGSTGIPFSFYCDRENAEVEYAFMYNAWESIGWRESDIGIKLRGAHLGDNNHLIKKTGYHRYALTASFMTEANYGKYMELIADTKATFLHVYPSTLTDLSHLIVKNHDEGKLRIKHIFLGSENLYTWQKDFIKRAFPEARLMSWYGHTERALWAPWCEKEERYHLNPFYGYGEILNGDKDVDEGEVGELVGTAFWMFGTPFIRYRTNDFAEKGPDYCDKCGRQFQMINHIDGRLSEIIIGKTGRRISLTVFAGSIMHGKTFDHIKQFRFIQKEQGKLTLAIVPTNAFEDEDLTFLKQRLNEFLGDDFICEISKVEELAKTKSGKFSYLEQHLSVERADNINY